jgi:hypothetical protein
MNAVPLMLNDDRQFAERDLSAFLLQAVRREHPEWEHAEGLAAPYREYISKISRLVGHTQPLQNAA